MSRFFYFTFTALILISCTGNQPASQPIPIDTVPKWAQEAVWYQIFVERFRNGDPSNDPRLEDIQGSWPHDFPSNWQVTPWSHDWYKQESWAKATGKDFYTTIQMRRYGGDLQGVLDKLDDLADLGITALYFNPLNDAPSLHKYDARNYHHIDRNFGPDPIGDQKLIATEIPDDPKTWVWTSADKLFLKLIEEAHKRGMKVIMDYSWNHTGITFWAWQDVLKNQAKSTYAEWYEIESFKDPNKPGSEFRYSGWAGVAELPEFKKLNVAKVPGTHAIEGTLHPEVIKHVFEVTRRWMDPNGDGDPSDGVDGFRLDVAEMVPLGFWREYRKFVRNINPEAYLVGEIWWEKWPEKMMDPAPYLQGDVFDAIMNYRWYMPTRSLFANAEPKVGVQDYFHHLDSVAGKFKPETNRAMMNLTSSHDAPRFSSSIQNPQRYKYMVNPRETPAYNILPATAQTRAIQKLMLVQQFTYIGAPMIWNGDEFNMWGADDPDNRKPIIWPDLNFDPERTTPTGKSQRAVPVTADLDFRAFIKTLISLRKSEPALIYGEFIPIQHDELVVYLRTLSTIKIMVLLNPSQKSVQFTLSDDPEILLHHETQLNAPQVTINARGFLVVKLK